MVRGWHLVVVGLAILGHATVSTTEAEIPGVERMRVASAESHDRIFTDLRHQRLGIVRGGRQHVWLDGEVTSLNVGRVWGAVFSGDGQRVAWVVWHHEGVYVVVDGEKGPHYDGMDAESLVFSPDGKRVAYAAVGDNRWHFVVDHSEGPEYDATLGTGSFSLDGRGVAYVGMKEARAIKFHKSFKSKRKYEEDRAKGVFSIEDLCRWRLRLWRIEHPKCAVVLNGVEGPPFEDILPGSPVFSPDGQHVAYGGKEEAKWVLVLDGNRMAEWDEIGDHSITFSPDSAQVAYTARAADTWAVMVDDARGPEYDALSPGPPIFSCDGERMGYAAQKGDKWRLVVNGTDGPECDDILVGPAVFGPDGSRTAFAAESDGKWRMIVDGVPGPECNGILPGSPVFSPDGRRIAYGARMEGREWRMMVDHEEVGSPIIGLPQFQEDGTLQFLTVEGAVIADHRPLVPLAVLGPIPALIWDVIGGKARAIHRITVPALP